MLLNEDNNPSQGTKDIKNLKRKIGETESIEAAFPSLNSPTSHVITSHVAAKSIITPTPPVKGAQVTRKWLETVISPLPSKPSPELERMLVIHDKGIVDEVTRRANIVLTALFPISQFAEEQQFGSSMQDMESLWSVQRRSEALKLYLKVLESICQSEAQRLKTSSDLSRLLGNERFHRCLIACSAELVSAAHMGNGMLLSVLFERTGITAFDMSKVMESFVIHEPTLPRELRRHLNSLEEQLLERRVWEKGSSLYNSLIIARPALADEINRLQLLAEPMPSLKTIALHNPVYSGGLISSTILQKHNFSPAQDRGSTSPRRACTENVNEVSKQNSTHCPERDCPSNLYSKPATSPSPSLQNVFTSPTQPNAHGENAYSETAINFLLKKMSTLAAIRIQSIAERLKLSRQFMKKVYFLFQKILTQRTSLFFNQHMYQIILCCFYGIGKTSGTDLTMKQILDTYMKQPQHRPQVVCPVSGNQEKNRGQFVELIAIYNKIFLPSAKSLLEEICSTEPPAQIPEIKNNDDSPNSILSPFPSLPDISPKKVSPSHNVYLSPVRLLKDDFTSNMTRSYYAFVGESIYPYESPSKQLSDINEHLNRTRKVRRRLDFDNADVAMISDDVVVKSLFPENNYRTSS